MSTVDLGKLARDRQQVRKGFWTKARKTLGRVPFSEDAVAAFYCATDSRTPLAVRATLLGALAYFIVPIDFVPDIIAGLGYTDDAAVIFAAIKAAQMNIMPEHRRLARQWLLKEQPSPT
ncbi:MAG TPA: YkvA family protein [Reyranellaceae bacterium]|nr:YkvA family protein [Reyranellaceae bacterium]